MQTIAAAIFKAKCLAIMDEVQSKREAVLITKNGKPVARLVPVEENAQDTIFGFYAGKLQICGGGGIDTPTMPGKAWQRLK